MVTVVSSTEIMVTWDMVPAINQNGMITMYEVQFEPLDDFGGLIQTNTSTIMAPMMLVLLVDLEEFVTYNISVRAYTNVGAGPYSVGMANTTEEDSK